MKNLRVLALIAVMVGGMTTLVAYAPTLYQMFCSLTGFAGTVQRKTAPAKVADSNGTITVLFDANVAPGLDWEFRPVQRKVVTKYDEPTQVYYYAKNNTDETIVARATFNVTPFKAAPYFFKIQCFCFTDEKLGPGESAKMPLTLYVDKEILKDPDNQDVHEITLSYTFFKQSDLSDEEVGDARDLKAGSEEEEAQLSKSETATFENDARRQ